MPARWLVPSYRTHAEIFAQGAPLPDGEEPPREAVALLLANPNNPDGRILPPARLLQWLAGLEEGGGWLIVDEAYADAVPSCRSEEHTSELQSLMRISYAVFCLKKK